jgi:hypothetical protein
LGNSTGTHDFPALLHKIAIEEVRRAFCSAAFSLSF